MLEFDVVLISSNKREIIKEAFYENLYLLNADQGHRDLMSSFTSMLFIIGSTSLIFFTNSVVELITRFVGVKVP